MQNANQNPQFEQHFAAIYGERWPALKAALLGDPVKITLTNPFGPSFQNYDLDQASVLPVKHLDLQPGENMADLCASPGGKTLAAIFALKGAAQWYCNDLSPIRVSRLKAILHDCLPAEVMARVRVSRGDASRWGLRHAEAFDRILADVPCSGERHLLHSAKELERWSAKSSRRLAVRQHAILCAAIDSVRPGGRVVYSTCSISPGENDGVIEKLMKSRQGRFQVIAVREEMGEPTAHGWMILPDASAGGPLYFSVLEKN